MSSIDKQIKNLIIAIPIPDKPIVAMNSIQFIFNV